MVLMTLVFLVLYFINKKFQVTMVCLMLFNSIVGFVFLLDCKVVNNTKVRWLIKIVVSLTVVYFWWITNSWILLDILVIGLLFILCETIWLYGLKHALYLLLAICSFEWIWKYFATGTILGPTIFDVMVKDMNFQSLPIAFLMPFFTPNPERC